MDKKVLLGIGALVIILVAGGFALYYYYPTIMGSDNPGQTVEPIGTDNGASFTVCAWECGDGVCQVKAPECEEGDINCACVETHEECPEDCK